MPSTNPPDRPAVFELASDDDLHFQNPVSVDQLISFLQNPLQWIGELNGMKRPEDPDVDIRHDFVLRLQLRNKLGVIPPDGKECLLQGINGAGVITIRPRVSLTPSAGIGDWDGYWRDWRDNGQLKVVYNTDFNQGYGHIELTLPTDSAEVRADKIAAFLILGSDPSKALVGSGPYLNAILDKIPLDQKVTKVAAGAITEEVRTTAIFKHLAPDDVLNVDFTLAGNLAELSTLQTRLDEGETPPVACDNLAGVWNPTLGLIVLDDTVVKDYAEKPKPGEGGRVQDFEVSLNSAVVKSSDEEKVHTEDCHAVRES